MRISTTPGTCRHWCASGFTGPVYATPYTAALTRIVLEDSARLQEEEADFANRAGYSKHTPRPAALHRPRTPGGLSRRLDAVAFGTTVELGDGVQRDAPTRRAHPGVGVDPASPSATASACSSAATSGDPPPAPRAARARSRATDTALVESTYGNRVPRTTAGARAARRHRSPGPHARGGVVVIPAFAVDRTEVMLHQRAARCREADGYRSCRSTSTARWLSPCSACTGEAIASGDAELRAGLADEDPFATRELHEHRSTEESKAINRIMYPVDHHLVVGDGERWPCPAPPRAATARRAERGGAGRLPGRGHTGPDAGGRRAWRSSCFGRYVPGAREVAIVDAFSVHADADELMEWLRPAAAPATLFVVHGEASASAALRDG